MRTSHFRRFGAWLTLFALVVTLAGIIPGGAARPAAAGSRRGPKLSQDLRERVRGARGGERVTVIVQRKEEAAEDDDEAVAAHGGKVKEKFAHVRASVVELPASKVEALAERDDIEYVSPDREMYALGHASLTTGADAARLQDTTTSKTNTPLVGIAVLDSGVDSWHRTTYKPDGSGTRVTGNFIYTGETVAQLDGYGHGTHVASAAAGSALIAGGAYKGVAHDAGIINVKVLDAEGRGSVSGLLRAIDWVIANRTTSFIRVVNLSLGMPAIDSYRDDPVCKAVRRMVDLGIVVVTAAGNDGRNAAGQKVYGAIHSPGIEPSAITVGASNTFGTDARNDDGVATYSSRGPTRGHRTDLLGVKHYDNLIKPDLVAPGNKMIWAASADNLLLANNPQLDAGVSTDKTRNMMTLNGTSMAAPLVAGAAALLLRHNPRLTPNLVKAILTYTAQPLAGFNPLEQGAGQLNVEGAVRLAKLVRTDLPQFWNPSVLNVTMPLGSSLLKSGVAPPAPQTTIAGHTFNWSRGLILDHATASGADLMTKYQKVYGTGVVLGDATLLDAAGVMLADFTLLTNGVVLGDHLMTSTGITLSEGSFFMDCGVLLNDGTLLGDGVVLGDGVLLSDGVILGDGVMLGDGTLRNDFSTQAQAASLTGDETPSMAAVKDAAQTTTTTSGGKRK